MNERSVVIIGLPESGKTTFLAALWHLITARDVETILRFHTLRDGESSHLNAIAARWRDAKVQDRTALGGNQLVSMNLQDVGGTPVRVTFPDVDGEVYRRIWEERDCEADIADILKATGVLLFIHADTIRQPKWVIDEVALSKAVGLTIQNGEDLPWHPRLAPTQVKLVDLLQLLCSESLNVGPRRLAIMLSAWDKAVGENLSPQGYLGAKLPLFSQYLRQGADRWTWRTYGVSAQGGEYDPIEPGHAGRKEAEELRDLDCASTRIRLICSTQETHDLTDPLAWLIE